MNRLDRAAAEPFRAFFPLGGAASVVGVLLWPAYFAGWVETWPLEAHARWMVVGFGGCFVTGFLGTAGPRLLGTDPWCRFELLWHLAMALAVMACLATQAIGAADLLTGFWLIGVLTSLLFRLLVGRRDVPPPGLPIALLGVLGAAFSAFVLSVDGVLHLSAPLRGFCRLMLFQGLLWLPVLGVAPYLLPRFFGRDSRHSLPESRAVPRAWWKPFTASLVAGLALIASFWIEVRWGGRPGMALRAAVVLGYLAGAVPGWFGFSKVNGLGLALRWILPAAAGGWWLAAAFPPLRIGSLHLMFIGGTGLILLAVATRVMLGHAGRHDRLASPMRWMHGLWFLTLFTAATRVAADFVPAIRTSHYLYAAMMWTVVVGFWAWKLRREKRMPERSADDEIGTPMSRPKRSTRVASHKRCGRHFS